MYRQILHAARIVAASGWLAALPALAGTQALPASEGVVTVRSAFSVLETVARIRKAVSEKGITFFGAVDQAALGANAGLHVRSSILLMFGNPALGVQFLAANPLAGLDWPVRLLVIEDDQGQVWTAYTDFAWIAQRHHIASSNAAFAMATKVVGSINDAVRAP